MAALTDEWTTIFASHRMNFTTKFELTDLKLLLEPNFDVSVVALWIASTVILESR